MEFIDFAAAFFVYAFLGWIIESGYRTVLERRGFINSGFLHGPLIPVYGFGAVAVMVVNGFLQAWPIPARVAVFTLLGTVVEYVTGWLFESLFRVKLWDYSKFFMNLHGRVCLYYSSLWAVLSVGFLVLFDPAVHWLVLDRFGSDVKWYAVLALSAATALDTVMSARELTATARILEGLREQVRLFNEELTDLVSTTLKGHQLNAFPNLRRLFMARVHAGFFGNLADRAAHSLPARVLALVAHPPVTREDMDPDFVSAVRDLLDSEPVRAMEGFKHHDASTLRHSLTVSQTAFLIARELGLDAVSTARGALLHDLYLYDWRTPEGKGHATGHPHRALRNARKHFDLNEIEADIIVKHMWPLTRPFFRYREALLVSLVDKMVSSKDVMNMFVQLVSRKEG